MRKKHAPEQYAAKPKPMAVKPVTKSIEYPSVGVAKQLVGWLDRGGVPPSIILLHGLHFARSRDNDGYPVDVFRPHLVMQGTDSKAVSAVMDDLARTQADKTKVIAAWLQANWVKKLASGYPASLSQKKPDRPIATNKPVKPKRKATAQSATKPVIVVKRK
jgi:hypothetical protein